MTTEESLTKTTQRDLGAQAAEQTLVAEEWDFQHAPRSRYTPERDVADEFETLDDWELDLVPARCLAREGIRTGQRRRGLAMEE